MSSRFPERVRPRHWREGTTPTAVAEMRPVWSADVLNDPAYDLSAEMRSAVEAEGYRAVLSVPLVVGGTALGALAIYRDTPGPFSAEEVAQLQAFADQAAVAIDNARRAESAQGRLAQLRRVARMTHTVDSPEALQSVLDVVAEAALDLLGGDLARIWLVDESQGLLSQVVLKAAEGTPDLAGGAERLPLAEGMMGTVVARRETRFTRDLREEAVTADDDWLAGQGFVSRLAVPMLVGERPVGVLGVLSRAPRQFSEEDRELLEIFAATAATALENARLYAEAGRAERAARAKAEELATLHEVGTRLAATLDVQAVLEAVAESAARLIGAHRAVVFELDSSEQRLRPRVVRGVPSARPIMGVRVGQGASGSAVALRRPVFSADVELEPTPGFDERPDGSVETLREVFRAQGYRAVLAVPLMSREEVMGALAVFWEDVHPRDEDEIRLLTALARQAALAIDNAQLYGEAQRRLRETAALLDIARAIASTLELTPLLKTVAEKTAQALGVERCSIFLVTDGHLRPVMSQFADGHPEPALWRTFKDMGRYRPEDIPAVVVCVRDARSVVVDVQDEATRDLLPSWWTGTFDLKNVLVVPLVRQGRVIGVLHLDNTTERRPIGAEQIGLAQAIASQVALTLDNVRLFQETQAQRVRLGQILDSTSDGILFVGPDGRIEAANPRAAEVLALEPRMLVGADLGRLLTDRARPAGADGRAHAARLFSRLFGDEGGEGDLELPDVQQVLHWVSRPTRDAAGRTVGLTVTVRDVTEEREVSQMKTDFVTFVTHQLRTPLAGIKWMLELASDEVTAPADARGFVHDALGASERLIKLVNDLLDVSRLERAKIAVEPRPTDLVALTLDVLEEVEPLVMDKGHRLTMDGGAGVPPVVVDPQLMRQVVLNLVSNAIKYTPPGGEIAILVGSGAADVQWSIRDTGIGVPRSALERLFEKFYRADNAQTVETEGTGLGLYLVRLILERFGGRVGCESEEGRGATFLFTLPISREEAHGDDRKADPAHRG